MKKILLLFTLLLAYAAPSMAADKTVYLDGNGVWNDGRFVLEMKNAQDELFWVKFTLAPEETSIYKATVPEDKNITSIKICRMNSNNEDNTEGNIWNYKGWFDTINDNALFKITGWVDGLNDYQETTYSIATFNAVYLKGAWNQWEAVEGEELTLGTAKTVDLSNATANQEFKLFVDNGTNEGIWLGYGNVTLTDEENLVNSGNEGNFSLSYSPFGYKSYDFTAEWTENTDAARGWTLTVASNAEGGFRDNTPAIVGTLFAEGENDGWSSDHTMTRDATNWNIFTLTIDNFETGATSYNYKLRTNENWNVFDLPDDGTNNSLVFDEAGTYTLVFTADVVAKTLTVTKTKKIVLPGTAIWSSETPVAANWGNNISVAKEQFANAKVGDKVHVAVEGVTPNPGDAWSAQVCLKAGNWNDIEGGVPVGNGTVQIASFVLTGDMLTYIKQYGMFAAGNGYSSRYISLESVGTEPAGSENSIWVGNAPGSLMINNKHFLNANGGYTEYPEGGPSIHHNGVKAGDIIRVTYTTNENATDEHRWIYVGYNVDGWPSYEMPQVEDGNVVEFMVKEDNPETFMNNETVINHSDHFIVTQVELLPAEFTGYYLVGGTDNWAVSETPLTAENNEYSVIIPYTSDYSFALVPNTALNTSNNVVMNWGAAIRPESQTTIDFENISGTGSTTDNGQNWKMRTLGVGSDQNSESLAFDAVLTYDKENNAWAITASTTTTIGTTGYATYSNAKPYQVEGATANFVTVEGSEATLVAQDANAILPAMTGAGKNAGIVLTGEAGTTTTVTIKAVASDAQAVDASENLLAGSGNYSYGIGTQFDEGDEYTAYILAVPEGKEVGFYRVADNATNKTLAAHKAFLAIPKTNSEARDFIGFGEGETTSISEELRMKSDKFATAPVYNLNGQRVAQPTKGLYIVNGKKVVIK